MKQLAITIICACLALAAMAQLPKPDAARLRQAFKNRPAAAATSVGQSKTGQVSLHQFMRERNLTPNDNRLLKKAPNRGTQRDQSDMIAVAEVQAIDDFDDEGVPILSDEVYSLGWKVSVSDDNFINGFYGSYSLQVEYDDAGVPRLLPQYLACDTLQGSEYNEGSQRFRVDTLRYVVFYTEACIEDLEDQELVGTVYDDGSIWFNGRYFVLFEDVLVKYRRTGSAWTGYSFTYVSTEYVDVVSPMYGNLCLLQPNGVHECDYQIDLSSYDLSGVDFSTTDFSTLIVGGGGSGNLVVLDDTGIQTQGGLHPKPIDPRRYLDPSEIPLKRTADPWTSWQSVLINSSGTLEAPIYMFQLDDSTLCVYNMYNAGYTASIITLHPDGSFTMPPQVLFYGDEDYYNCSLEDGALYLGNTGNATNESITWGTTIPVGVESQYRYKFDNNSLHFTDGNQFVIGYAQEPTIEVVEEDDAYTFTAISTEAGAELCLVTLDDDGNVIECVDNPYVVQRTDQEQVINLAAIASVPGKNDSYYISQYVIPAKQIIYPRGDTNLDGQVSLRDVTVLINFLLSGQWSE